MPIGMDTVIKEYFDKYRGKLPPELTGRIDGILMPDTALMDKWRNWRTGLEYYDKELDAVLFGALDDCLVDAGCYIPLDYKTKGSLPSNNEAEKYYQTQLDSYALLLNSNGYKTKDSAYIVYYSPQKIERDGLVRFNINPFRLETSLERIKNTFSDAVNLLKGNIPRQNQDCEYCNWFNRMADCKFKEIPRDLFEA